MVKKELNQMDFDNYRFDFTISEDVYSEEIQTGDKVLATMGEFKINSKPRRAKVQEIKKVEID